MLLLLGLTLIALSGQAQCPTGNVTLNSQAQVDLSTCAIESICRLLATSVRREIYSNAPGCNSSPEVQALCNGLATTGLAASSDVVCVGSPVTFTATATNAALPYAFTLTNGSSTTMGTASSRAFSQSLVASGSGNQSFTLTVSSGGQTATAITGLTVNALLQASVTPSTATLTCTNPSVNLTASGGSTGEPFTYVWDDNSTDAMRSVSSAGTYSVTVTGANGCTALASATVSEDKTPPTAPALSAARSTPAPASSR